AAGNSFPLAPNGTATFYYETTATQDLVNTADATGTPTDENGDPLGVDDVTSPPDDAEVALNPVPGAIGDFVWYDANNDGIQDVGEPGIPNVTLDLYNADNNTLVKSTTTSDDGGYIFTDLPAGNYYVDITDVNGVLTTYNLTVGPQSETDPSATIALAAGEFYEDADFGYVQPTNGDAIIGDTVFYDGNGNGVQDPGEPGIPNVTVIATDSNSTTYTAVTDDNGNYLIPVPAGDSYSVAPDPGTLPGGLTATTPVPQITPVLAADEQYLDADFGYDSPQLGIIGNQVWFDTGLVPGTYDSGSEAGVPGVTVDLWVDADGSGTLTPGDYIYATVVTDENGQYQFGGVPAGDYLVNVSDTANVLDDYIPTTILGPTGDNFNKAQPYPVTLAAGATNNTADFGYVPNPSSPPGQGIIGNQLWYESGASVNGLFEPEKGDIGLAGIVVELLDSQNTVILTQTTGSSGLYAFTSLPAGDYRVRVGDSSTYPVNGSILADYIPTVLIGGTADNTNKDEAGYPVALAADEVNMTADFGYTDLSVIGDFIWWDQNEDGIQDAGEPGIPGVTVTLLDSGGNPVGAPVITGPNGEYLFENLLPGDYTVVVTPPTNGLPSPINQTVDTADSDFGPTNQVNETLTLGEQNLTIDGGFYFDTRYEIVKVRNTPDPVRVGDPISYTITITNLGTSIITSLPLTDTYDPNFLDYVSATPAPTSTDEPNGTLFWADLLTNPLAQNDAVSVVVEFTGLADTGTDAANNPNNNPTPPDTFNVASSAGGTYDPDGPNGLPPTQPLPPVEDDEPVQIINPTSVMVATAGAGRSGTSVTLRWTTATEVDVVGFNVIRLVNGDATQLNGELIVAEYAGQAVSGVYALVDSSPSMGELNIYRLEILMADGRVEQHAPGVLNMAAGQIYSLHDPLTAAVFDTILSACGGDSLPGK
ncbi:MAG: SdrD B-like domain-containing protein, partial [Caldilineaceae bacterium]